MLNKPSLFHNSNQHVPQIHMYIISIPMDKNNKTQFWSFAEFSACTKTPRRPVEATFAKRKPEI